MNHLNAYQARQMRIRDYLAQRGADAALISTYENRRYFCGFTGSNGYLVISRHHPRMTFITDRRYTTQAAMETSGQDIDLVEHAADRLKLVAEAVKSYEPKTLVIEESMAVGEYNGLSAFLPDIQMLFENEAYLEMRMVKSPDEIAAIRKAIRCAEEGFERLVPKLLIGMTERELANELHYLVSQSGAEAMSFGTIVGSGPRGALAHAFPTDRVIQDGDMVVVDFGVMKDGYCSDMTRTLLFGNVSKAHRRIFDLVEESRAAAVAAVRPGILARGVEDAHRVPFLREGLNDYALKGLGHGIGLEIHECPRIVIGNMTRLVPGMVFTIEPGLYFPDDCGVRIEDDVLVTEDGVENLSQTPHEIHITRKKEGRCQG